MPFRGLLRPFRGFKPFTVLSREGTLTDTGRPQTGEFIQKGTFIGIISQATTREQEQWKQLGSPISHTIVQRGTCNRAKATDVLRLDPPPVCPDEPIRYFQVQGEPQDPGELGHFLVYHVLERRDLQ